MIDSEDVMLLAQLADSMSQSFSKFQEAYDKNDKKRFDSAKEAMLDFQKKIAFVLKKK